jgi:FkbM family methyltransferase
MKAKIFKIIIRLWSYLPFKIFLARIIKLSPNLTHKLYQDLKFSGIMTVKLGDKKFKLFNTGYSTIENEIFWKGLNNGWEKISINTWINLSKISTIIIDIGANTGIYSITACTVNTRATIYSFEPVKRTAKILLKNIEINNFTRIKFFETAISNENGSAKFYDVDAKSQYSASLNKEMLSSSKNVVTYDVPVKRLESYEFFTEIKVDLIKLDVEMHEPQAIDGMLSIIARDKPTILIEVLNNTIANQLNIQLAEYGYEYYLIDEINQPRLIHEIIAFEYHNILVIQPEIANKIGLK